MGKEMESMLEGEGPSWLTKLPEAWPFDIVLFNVSFGALG
jgi:hypothetical protein